MTDRTYTKAYLVEFTDKRDGYSFLKFGATNDYDVMKRFQHEPEQYKDYKIEVIGSIYANQNNVNYKRMGEVEQYFLSKYPRNTKYFKDNFSGISETYQPTDDSERKRMIREFYDIRMRESYNIHRKISRSLMKKVKTGELTLQQANEEIRAANLERARWLRDKHIDTTIDWKGRILYPTDTEEE